MGLISTVFLAVVVGLLQLAAISAAVGGGLVAYHNRRPFDSAVGQALVLSAVATFVGQLIAMYQMGMVQLGSYIGYGFVFLVFMGTLIVNLLICTLGGYLVGLYLLNSKRIAQYSESAKHFFGTPTNKS